MYFRLHFKQPARSGPAPSMLRAMALFLNLFTELTLLPLPRMTYPLFSVARCVPSPV